MHIIQFGILELTTRMREALRVEEPFRDKLRRFVMTFLQFLQKHEAFFRIMHAEKMRTSVDDHYRMHQYAADAYTTIFGITSELIRQGQQERVLRGDTPENPSRILLGILEAHVYHRVLLAPTACIEEDVGQLIDYFLNGAKSGSA